MKKFVITLMLLSITIFFSKAQNSVPTTVKIKGAQLMEKAGFKSDSNNIIHRFTNYDTVLVFGFENNYYLIKYDTLFGYISKGLINENMETIKLRDQVFMVEENKKIEIRRIELEKKYNAEIANKIIYSQIWIGMTEIMALDSRGYPDDINRTVVDQSNNEQWVYRGSHKDIYLYFENGILISWQD